MKHDIYELYGAGKPTARLWRHQPYGEVLQTKIRLAKIKIKKLTEGTLTDAAMTNIKLCQNSVEFNEALLKEIE